MNSPLEIRRMFIDIAPIVAPVALTPHLAGRLIWTIDIKELILLGQNRTWNEIAARECQAQQN